MIDEDKELEIYLIKKIEGMTGSKVREICSCFIRFEDEDDTYIFDFDHENRKIYLRRTGF